jgi:agmatinase
MRRVSLDEVLRVDQKYIIDHTAAGGVTLWDPSTGRKHDVTRSVSRLLGLFAFPTAVGDVVEELGMDPAAVPGFVDGVAGLVSAGLLVDARSTGRTRVDSAGAFGAPMMTLDEGLVAPDVDALIMGVEYDAGASHRSGSRFAPDALRRASGSLFDAAGRTGMYDPVRSRRILAGVGMADVGNLSTPVQQRNGPIFDQLAEFSAACARRRKVAVAIGGDHSLSLAMVHGQLRHHDRLGVIHLDAHSDFFEPLVGDWRSSLHHGNVMGWIAGLEKVDRIVQFGIRQLTSEDPHDYSKVIAFPGDSACVSDPTILHERLPRDIPWHLTIDVDVLDPAYLPSTGTPLPGGLAPRQVFDLVELLCAERSIVSIDLVELIPTESDHSVLLAAEVLLRALDAALPVP